MLFGIVKCSCYMCSFVFLQGCYFALHHYTFYSCLIRCPLSALKNVSLNGESFWSNRTVGFTTINHLLSLAVLEIFGLVHALSVN